MAGARVLLLAVVAHVHAARYALREGDSCGFGHYGSPAGSAQRLLVTHLMPAVADWNVAVPMPPICKDAQVTGVDMSVCDGDMPPQVIMHDLTSARVHRPGQLKGFAAVNVTVYCILPKYSLSSHSTTTPRQLDESLSSEEVMSNELITNEVMSYEDTLHDFVPNGNGLTSIELMPKEVEPVISSTTSPPPPEDTTPLVELTTLPEEITPPPKPISPTYEMPRQSLKVTIKISPPHKSPRHKKKRKPQSYEVHLPAVSNKEKSHEVISYQTPEFATPYIVTPPRYSETPSLHRDKSPRPREIPLQYAVPLPHNPDGSPPRHVDLYPQYTGAPPHQAWEPPSRPEPPPQYQHQPPVPAHQYAVPPVEQLLPPRYDVPPPRVLSRLFRPPSLLRPRVSVWHKPRVIFRHF